MVKSLKFIVISIFLVAIFLNTANSEVLFQDEFTATGISSQWITNNQAIEFSATISQPGDGFLYIEASGGNGFLISGIEHNLDFPPTHFIVSVKLKADLGGIIGHKRGQVTIFDNENNRYIMQLGRDGANTWAGQVCFARASGVNSGCINTEVSYTAGELVEFSFIKENSTIMFYLDGVLLFGETTEFNTLNKTSINVSTHAAPDFFSVLFDNIKINSIVTANCPSSESDEIAAVITDHTFIAIDNNTADNSCLASSTITLGGTPSKSVIIQDGAEVKIVAPNGISFRPGVVIEHGSSVSVTPQPVQSVGG